MPRPLKGKVNLVGQLDSVSDEDWESKMRELRYLRELKRKGVKLSDEQQKRFVELEKEEDEWRHKQIEDLEAKSKRSKEEEEKLQ